ncbi:MAG: hypothetical protein JW956_06875 [Calditrichaceae bacterium]|nr:hypothetical protein [Calditrichaceae bacterium]
MFDLDTWLRLFNETGFQVKQERPNHLYDDSLMQEGEYLTRVFICHKPEY